MGTDEDFGRQMTAIRMYFMPQNSTLKSGPRGYFYALHTCHIKELSSSLTQCKIPVVIFLLVSRSKLKCAKPSAKNIIKGRLSYCVKWGKIRQEAEVLERKNETLFMQGMIMNIETSNESTEKKKPTLELTNKIRIVWTYKKSNCHISSSKWLEICLKVGKIKLLELYLTKNTQDSN